MDLVRKVAFEITRLTTNRELTEETITKVADLVYKKYATSFVRLADQRGLDRDDVLASIRPFVVILLRKWKPEKGPACNYIDRAIMNHKRSLATRGRTWDCSNLEMRRWNGSPIRLFSQFNSTSTHSYDGDQETPENYDLLGQCGLLDVCNSGTFCSLVSGVTHGVTELKVAIEQSGLPDDIIDFINLLMRGEKIPRKKLLELRKNRKLSAVLGVA